MTATRDKIYFASDFHLGAHPMEESESREKILVNWLDSIKKDASELYLMGDVFDFWFEYHTVIPKGYIRFIGKLAELADMGIKITFFKGNHDMWMFGYFKEELGAEIIDNEAILILNEKTFYLHHGDGLGPGDRKYKFLKKIFRSRICQWFFARLHPNLGIGIARLWSKSSRISNKSEEKFLGEDREWLIQYALEVESKKHHDYYIFGHRHLPYLRALTTSSKIANLGEWINYYSFGVWDGNNFELRYWKPEKSS